MNRNWKNWAKKAGIRAVKTVAETALAMIPVGVSVAQVGWLAIGGTALLAGILSMLTSVAGIPEEQEGQA